MHLPCTVTQVACSSVSYYVCGVIGFSSATKMTSIHISLFLSVPTLISELDWHTASVLASVPYKIPLSFKPCGGVGVTSFLFLAEPIVFENKKSMLNIPYYPKAFIFTSYLPDTIEIVSDAPSVKVGVKCDDELVFTATFYPYEGLATLHDIRSVVESNMEENRLNFVNFVINAETSEERISTNGCFPIYSRVDVESVYVPDFIRSHFLTTMSFFVIPQNGTQFLTYITEPNKVVNAYTECLVHVDGEESPRLVRLKENEATYDHTARNFVVVIPQRILKRLNVKGRIFQLTVHRGGLAKTFYVVDRIRV